MKDGGGKVKTAVLNELIDSGIPRVVLPNGKTKLETVQHTPVFTRYATRGCETKYGQYATGVILEEARARCGGQKDDNTFYLDDALTTGRVMCGSDGLYYFRSKHVGREDTFGKKEQAEAVKQLADHELSALEDAIGSAMDEGTHALDFLAGDNGGKGGNEVTAFEVGHPVGGKGGGKVEAVAKTELETKVTTLGRTIKLAEKMRDHALAASLSSSPASIAASQLMDTLESAEICHMKNGFVLKFIFI